MKPRLHKKMKSIWEIYKTSPWEAKEVGWEWGRKDRSGVRRGVRESGVCWLWRLGYLKTGSQLLSPGPIPDLHWLQKTFRDFLSLSLSLILYPSGFRVSGLPFLGSSDSQGLSWVTMLWAHLASTYNVKDPPVLCPQYQMLVIWLFPSDPLSSQAFSTGCALPSRLFS